jgi:SAM-dependent methyltransferase
LTTTGLPQGGGWGAYLERYRANRWRSPLLRDMILDDLGALPPGASVLDIGCGRGFDDDLKLQEQIAAASGTYVGVEPDPDIPVGAYFHQVHRTVLEEAPLAEGSVDLAFAVMVLEHLGEPQPFWDKVHSVLRGGGIFWGFTMDARHWFCTASRWMGRLRVKEFYLNGVMGRRRAERYENYPVHYRSNTPEAVARLAAAFSRCEAVNFARVGQFNHYLPRPLRPLGTALDRRAERRGRPGMFLAVRVVR